MRINRTTAILLSGALVLSQGSLLRAGGALETVDITGNRPSPIAGHIAARVIGMKWDARAIPVRYRVNSTLDPIPNPLGTPVLPLATATAAMQSAFDQWNAIPTSFIEMYIDGTVANSGLVGFDMVNELSFTTAAAFSAIASSPSTALIADVTLAHGDDIDGDGDADVSSAITRATDADGDGDIEFPAGFYEAGTILDNDVQFNTKVSNGFRFTVRDAALDPVTRSVDLVTVAVHEFGHSHGLSHSMDNQVSDTDGDGATMFPFIDTGDPFAELLQRSINSDDVAWSSYFYPEGTAKHGPAALQHGDVPFDKVYGLIRGEIRHGVQDQPLAGASVYAIDRQRDRVIASGYSGTTQLSFDPATGGLFLSDAIGFHILDGHYVVPVPRGNYAVGVEPVDGQPAAAGNISFTAQIGAFFGQQDFNEEFYNRNAEDDVEVRPGRQANVHVNPGKGRSGIDIVTGRSFNVNNFGSRDFIGFTGAQPGHVYAVQIPAAQIAALAPGEPLLAQQIGFNTTVLDASTTPLFAEAMLTTGVVHADGTATIDLDNPLDREWRFVGQENDFSPFFLKNPRLLGRRIRNGIANGTIENLFMVLRLPATAPFPGVSGAPPLIGLDGGVANNDAPIFGYSFQSSDGGATFTRVPDLNFMFSLVLSAAPGH